MNDLVAFLRARLDEDEAAAQEAGGPGWRVAEAAKCGCCAHVRTTDGTGSLVATPDDRDAEHIARHDPARVLREVAAKRAIVAEHDTLHWRPGIDALKDCQWTSWPCPTLRHVAAVYAGHPDYDEAWKP